MKSMEYIHKQVFATRKTKIKTENFAETFFFCKIKFFLKIEIKKNFFQK